MIKKMISTFVYKDKLELGGSVYIFIYKNVRENYPVHTLSIIALICEKVYHNLYLAVIYCTETPIIFF